MSARMEGVAKMADELSPASGREGMCHATGQVGTNFARLDVWRRQNCFPFPVTATQTRSFSLPIYARHSLLHLRFSTLTNLTGFNPQDPVNLNAPPTPPPNPRQRGGRGQRRRARCRRKHSPGRERTTRRGGQPPRPPCGRNGWRGQRRHRRRRGRRHDGRAGDAKAGEAQSKRIQLRREAIRAAATRTAVAIPATRAIRSHRRTSERCNKRTPVEELTKKKGGRDRPGDCRDRRDPPGCQLQPWSIRSLKRE